MDYFLLGSTLMLALSMALIVWLIHSYVSYLSVDIKDQHDKAQKLIDDFAEVTKQAASANNSLAEKLKAMDTQIQDLSQKINFLGAVPRRG